MKIMLENKAFFKDARVQYLLVLGSSVVNMVFGFAISLISTHVMETEVYGYYKAIINAVTMFTSFSTLGFSYTLSKRFGETTDKFSEKKLIASGIFLDAIIYVVLSLGIFSVWILGNIFGLYSIPSYVLLAGLFTLVMLLENLSMQMLQGQNRMVEYSLITIVPQFALALLLFVVYFNKLIISWETPCIVYFVSHSAISLYFLLNHGVNFKCRTELGEVIKGNKQYGFNIYLGSIMGVTAAQLLGLLVASVSGLTEYAWFSLGVSIASPMALIPAVMGIIHFKSNINSARISRKELLGTFSLTALVAIIYYFFTKYFLCFLIGEKYLNAIPYANVLMIYYMLNGLGDYFNKFVTAKGYGKRIRNGALVAGVLLVICAAVLIPIWNVNGLIVSKVISGAAYFIMMLLAYLNTVRNNGEENINKVSKNP